MMDTNYSYFILPKSFNQTGQHMIFSEEYKSLGLIEVNIPNKKGGSITVYNSHDKPIAISTLSRGILSSTWDISNSNEIVGTLLTKRTLPSSGYAFKDNEENVFFIKGSIDGDNFVIWENKKIVAQLLDYRTKKQLRNHHLLFCLDTERMKPSLFFSLLTIIHFSHSTNEKALL